MSLFGSRPSTSVGELVARKRHAEAIELLRARLADERNTAPLRMQLADVLVAAGRAHEAVPILVGLADEMAAEGLMARAMAILKRVQKIDPGRAGLETRLASFLPGSPAPPPAPLTTELYEPRAVSLGSDPSGAAAPTLEPVIERFEAPARPAPRPAAPAPAPDVDDERAAAAALRKELLDTIQDVLAETAADAPPAAKPVRSPLFGSLSEDELLAVFRGLRLLSFEPGDLILHQGDEGNSMFVLTSGSCKAFIKEPGGRRQIFIRLMEEGDFFGEISLLRGEPRSATVIAASACELLELDRQTLENLCRQYPRVRDVLEDFAQQRLATQGEVLARRERHGSATPAAGEDPA